MFASVLDQNICKSDLDLKSVGGKDARYSCNTSKAHSPMTEDALAEAAKSGDLGAFNDLVLQHQDSLYWWVFSLVHDEAQAADIVQSTFITAFEKMHIYNGGSFRAWIFRIARNRSFDEFRRLKRRPSISLDAPLQENDDHEFLSNISSDEPTPEELVIDTEQSDLLLSILDRLPYAFRQVLQLVDIDGLDYREAADLLQLPLGTFKSRVSRARVKLRDMVIQSGKFTIN